MKHILIIGPNWIGDVLFTTPAVKAIREAFPDAHIGYLLPSRCAPIIENNPDIDEIILLKTERGLKGLIYKLGLVPGLKSKQFDTAFLFHRSMSHALMCMLAGIKKRIGYYTRKGAPFLTDKIPYPETELHRIEFFLNIVRSQNIDVKDKDCKFFITNEQFKEATDILKKEGLQEGDPYFVVNPGGNWMLKRWPKQRFADLCNALQKAYNKKIAITGSEKDKPLGDYISKSSNANIINLCGKTNIKQLGAILKKAKLVISNDSGPVHIAVALETPSVAIFGPTSDKITGLYGSSRYVVVKKDVGCKIPCYDLSCKDNRCMKSITVTDVITALEDVRPQKP